MSNLDGRIDAAVGWLVRSQLLDGRGGAGWGWVSDVPPNPQNTAEVVCALAEIGMPIPRAQEVSTLVRRLVVERDTHGEWRFQAPIDLSWRLRALHCLGVSGTDVDVCIWTESLIAEQDVESGGWRMSSRVGAVSIIATANAIRALIVPASAGDVAAERAVMRGTGFLISTMLDQDPRVQPMHAAAYVAATLARPEIAAVGGKRLERARDLAVDRLSAGLRRGETRIETEPFNRGEVADTWRHLSLHLTIAALVAADPPSIFDPAVRQALVQLLDLQEYGVAHSQRGGFRTSMEGFVTSYATTQGLDALAISRYAVDEGVSPAKIFDLICHNDGAHPSDSQVVLSLRGRALVMNSLAGATLCAVGGAAGLTIALLAIAFAGDLGKIGGRALVVWGMLFVGIGSFAAIATRMPTVPKGRIATAVFAAYTAVVLPVTTFLLS